MRLTLNQYDQKELFYQIWHQTISVLFCQTISRKIFLEKNLKSYLHSLSLNLYMDKIEIYLFPHKIEENKQNNKCESMQLNAW